MPLQMIRATPALPPQAPPLPPQLPDTTSNAVRDWFVNVVRPDRYDPNEEKIAGELRKRITEYQSAESEFMQNVRQELDFLAGHHWLDYNTGQDVAKQLQSIGRSGFTIDLLSPSVDIIVNQVRINKVTPTFVPIGEGADQATAEIRQGLYRNIERVSKAQIARETAYQLAVSVGRGYERVVIEDEPGPTFARRIAIKRVDNLNGIAIDPTCVDFTYSDAAWAYSHDDYWRDEFVAEFGDMPDGSERQLDTMGLGLLDGTQKEFWFPKDRVKVGEYWRRVWKKREVWRLSDGREMWKEDVPKDLAGAPDRTLLMQDTQGLRPNIKSKMDSFLEWRKMTGTQTLEKRIWPGKLIPIVVFIGREVFRGSKPKIHSGMVKPAMDPSRIHDYMESRMVDEVGLSPLPHMFASTGQLSPEQKAIVSQINKHPWSMIEYTPQTDGQQRQLPPPYWASPSPNIAAVVQAEATSKDNLQRVLNTFAPQLGQQQGGQSGLAISQIKQQGDVSHAAFLDNYNRALTQEAEIVNELMDVVYTDAQAITITEVDDKTRRILINQEYLDEKTGKKKKHIFGVGQYAVVIGPAFPSSITERFQRIMDLAKTVGPAALEKVLDLLVVDAGLPQSGKYAERWRPPGFAGPDEEPSVVELTQQREQAMQQLQQADALIQQLLQKIAELGDKRSIALLQIASKERMAAASDLAGVMEAEAKAGDQGALAVLNTHLQAIIAELDHARDVELAAAQQSAPPGGGGGGGAPQPQQQPEQPPAAPAGLPIGQGAPVPSAAPAPNGIPTPQ